MFGAVCTLDMHVQNSLIKAKFVFNVYLTFGTRNRGPSSAPAEWGLPAQLRQLHPTAPAPKQLLAWGGTVLIISISCHLVN